jgi:hypothetical protein
MADDPTIPTKPKNIEAVLAEQANAAMAAGADPHQTTDMLGQMIKHLRANAGVAKQANDALAQGADEGKVAHMVWQVAQSPRLVAPKPAPVDDESAADRATGLIESGLKGATFGASNKLIAGAKAILPEAVGGTHGFDYARALRDTNADQEEFERKHPVASRLAEVAGSLPTVVATGGAGALEEGAGIGTKIASAALQGAKYGAAGGLLSSDKLEEVPKNVAKGTAIGAAVGPVLEGGARVIGAGARSLGIPEAVSNAAAATANRLPVGRLKSGLEAVSGAVGPKGEASSLISQRIAQGGKTPEELSKDVTRRTFGTPTTTASTGGSGAKPEIMADYSPPVAGLTKAVLRRPGSARAQVSDVIQSRAAGTAERVAGDVGNGTPVRKELETMVKERDASAAKKFPSAYAAGAAGVDDPALAEIMNRPSFKQAYGMAQKMAKDEGTQLPTKVVVKLNDGAQTLLDAAKPADHAALEAKLMSNPQAVTRSEVPVPDVRTIHYVDRAIRRMIDGGYEGNAPIVDPQHAGVLYQALSDLRQRMAVKVPKFGEALADYADRSKEINALQTGADVFKYIGGERVPPQALTEGDPLALKGMRKGIDGLEAAMKNMSPEEQALFRRGARSAVLERITNTPSTPEGSTTPILSKVFSPKGDGPRWQKLLFSTPEEAKSFQQALARERRMAVTGKRLGTGSDTAENLNEDASIAPGGGLVGALVHPVQSLKAAAGAAQSANKAKVVEALGPRLSAHSPSDLAREFSKLDAEQDVRGAIRKGGSAIRNAMTSTIQRKSPLR